MADPRAENCKAFHVTNGAIDGVKLEYRSNPSSLYELVRVELIGEAEAAGNTVASYQVFDKGGLLTGERVYLAWPWPNLEQAQLSGNQNGQHMITNGYDAAAGLIGPLALFVGDVNEQPISDVIGGLGLPNNRHVSFRLVWRERGAVEPIDPVDPGEPSATLIAALDRLTATLREAFRLP